MSHFKGKMHQIRECHRLDNGR